MKNILITGGAGFIGSHVVNHFVSKYPNYNIFVVDSFTYAADLNHINGISDINEMSTIPNLKIYSYDIFSDVKSIVRLFQEKNITDVIHLAAESHVDNSISDPMAFVNTNIIGTVNLLNIAKDHWGEGNSDNRFYHISTDEVYGDLEHDSAPFTEFTSYAPSSPYSASKAASDHFVRAYGRTYNMNTIISNCSNNYGPHQHNEKLIPTVIRNLFNGDDIPVYGTGENVRDWLWVGDHVTAIDEIFHNGVTGQTYNVGGNNELTNLELIKRICTLYSELYGDPKEIRIPIKFVEDRKGHDFRYSVNSNKLQENLNWKPISDMREYLIKTIQYYVYKYENPVEETRKSYKISSIFGSNIKK